MDSKAKWDTIEAASGEFRLFMMQAEENAQDTVYAERARPESEYHEVCIDTLGSILASSDDKAAQDFFWALGVKF